MFFAKLTEEEISIASMSALIKHKKKETLTRAEELLLIPRMEPALKHLRKARTDYQKACSACVFKLEGEPAERLPDVERHLHFTKDVDTLIYTKCNPDTNKMTEVTDLEIDEKSAMWKQYAQMKNGATGLGKHHCALQRQRNTVGDLGRRSSSV